MRGDERASTNVGVSLWRGRDMMLHPVPYPRTQFRHLVENGKTTSDASRELEKIPLKVKINNQQNTGEV